MGRRKRHKQKTFENLEVIDAGAKGKAVAKAPDGKVVFISGAVPGDVVNVQTIKKRSGFYDARLTELIKKSDKRVEPICEHFDWCGGCKWQHMGYEHQLYYKEKEVINNLQRIGHLELPEHLPILGCENVYYYRNKMEFSFASKRWLTPAEIKQQDVIDAQPACGFHISGMWDKVLDIDQCHLQDEPSNAIRNFIKHYAIEHQLAFFDPRTQTGFLRSLMIRLSSTDELMVLVQFFEDDQTAIQQVMQAVKEEFPQITSLLYVVNNKGNDTIYDQDVIIFSGKDFIEETMEDLTFKIRAKSFYQTNSKQAYELYKIVREFAGLKGDETVYDLYTGTGTIAQFVAKRAKRVIGIEAVPDAIKDAQDNAKNNKIDNVEFLVGDMKNVFNDDFLNKYGHPDVVITDPPRDGMHKDVVAQLLKIKPQTIVYVSCNSATQARDLALMKEDYKIVKIQPVDMFPQTHHVENVVLLALNT